jgi:hypothetical protein
MFRAGGQIIGGQMATVWWWQSTCSFSVSWCGEDFQRLGVQGAKVSALLGASPPPSMSPESQQVPWFIELMLSASVSSHHFGSVSSTYLNEE